MKLPGFLLFLRREQYRKEREAFFREIDEDIEETPKSEYVKLDDF